MNLDPEENLLDHSLRDIFQDYDLPPAEHMHVWAGVEEQLAALPAPRTSVPLYLLLPLTAALGVGVAVGWLLPRPAAWQAPEPAPATVRMASISHEPAAKTWKAQPTATVLPAQWAAVVEANVPATKAVTSSHLAKPASQRSGHSAEASAAAQRQASVTPTADDSAALSQTASPVVVANNTVTTGAPLPATTDSLALSQPASVPAAMATAANRPAVAATPDSAPAAIVHPATHPAKITKLEEAREQPILYRKPTHRKSEPARGIRRWFSNIVEGVRSVL